MRNVAGVRLGMCRMGSGTHVFEVEEREMKEDGEHQ